MENEDIQRSLIKSSDIESRLIILKRRAAEADFLREERDMLISRLRLYNPDYVWPDSGINKCLRLPIDKEVEEIEKKNENLLSENAELIESRKQLISENDGLKTYVKSLERELEGTKNDLSNFDAISKENEQLKVMLQEMNSLKNEKEQLLIEKEQLKEDISKLLDADSNEQDKNSKVLLKQLYARINQCSEQYNSLLKELWSKEVQIDVMTGKITQLNAKLNEPYISAKIKLSMGQDLSEEEAYTWAVYNLEMTNKKMNCELQKVSDQLSAVTEKYLKMKDELQMIKPTKKEMFSPHQLDEALLKLQENWQMKSETSASNIYDLEEGGSTAPVSRDASEESMFRPLGLVSSFNRLEILHENTCYMEEVYHKIMKLKIAINDKIRYKELRVSKLQDVNIRRTVALFE